MGRRSRRKFKLKLKKNTIHTISAILLFGTAGLVGLSYIQQGTILALVKDQLLMFFGWTAYAIPVMLILFGLMITGWKNKITQAHVAVGSSIFLLSILTITQAGITGEQIWLRLEELISGPGAFVILLAIMIIGLTILFNTSLDQLVEWLNDVIQKSSHFLQGTTKPFQAKKPEPKFAELQGPLRVKGAPLDDLKKLSKSPILPTKPAATQSGTSPAGEGITIPKPMDIGVWEYPPISLMAEVAHGKADRGDIKRNASTIEKTLDSFGIAARVVEVNLGPAVTQYALEIALGTKISKITSLASDLALALAAPTGTIRIEAPIPGRSLVGIEIPNKSPELVTMRQMLQSQQLRQAKGKLPVALGLDVSGQPVVADLTRMPHVLIAGTTGSGKSVFINSWILTLLFRMTPNEIKLILVDPKRVEMTVYNGIPHLLTPVIVDADKTLSALKWSIKEMERRYKLFQEHGIRNIDAYHEREGSQSLPYILIFIDELADLMMYAPVEVEESITRIAQMARAVGIHLIVSTQRPSVDVITGLIKANIPSRIAFNVSSMIDSKVILDTPGAEKLLGKGDMLYIPPDQAKPLRIQGTFVTDKEVAKLVDFLKKRNPEVQYTEEVISMPVTTGKKGSGNGSGSVSEDGKDNFFQEAIRIVCQYDRASASLLQRKLSIGYSRAARIIDQLEEVGIIGPGEGSKPRDVLVRNAEEFFAQNSTITEETTA